MAFEKNAHMKQLTKAQMDKITECMKISYYKAGDLVFKKGTPMNTKLIVVIEGSLKKVA